MANVNVSGFLMCSDGTNIPLSATLAEGTESNLTVNTTYGVSASNIGDFAPGKVVISGTIQAQNGIAYAYILRQGLIAAILPVSVKGISGAGPMPLCAGFQLQAGDVVRCMANTASDRECAISVYTNRGVSHIFAVTPSSGTTNEPVSILTGNSLGDTLQGQVIMKAFCTSVDGNKIDGGGALALSEKGIPVGGLPANNPAAAPVTFSHVSIPVALNYKWTLVTSS